ncbi:MAG: terminase small subunit [Sterolibacteriaceae bacterium]|uniref:Terminase small subunit n=1 Tax=Candidatus Methylophosphatis roskildensis TaxID=2899263 RepID=A0A9D7E2K0_9PROT|nr:terminase small subunit [Candidatus Methylophosphatis roskildensis]MBK7235815.1 terminase small subunit [Sterolibacteriaceae bacterium]
MTDQSVSVMPDVATPRERRISARIHAFVDAYVLTLNSARAARVAGYAPKASAVRGAELLRRPDVQQAIKMRQAELARRYAVEVENTIATLAAMAFFDPLDFFDDNGRLRNLGDVPLRARMALSGFKVRRVVVDKSAPPEEIIEIRFLDRGTNVERLMKHLGLFEKDNRQDKPDAIAELLAYVAAHGAPLAVRPSS